MVEDSRTWCFEFLWGCRKVDELEMNEKQFNQTVFQPTLRKIWQEVLRPVRVALLGLAPYARRIWICPTGYLAFLPLHAAINGLRDEVEEGFLELVPSYAVTLSSLLRARDERYKAMATQSSGIGKADKVLAVSCKGAEGYNDIRGAAKEVKDIAQLLSAPPNTSTSVTVVKDRYATVQAVLASMPDYPWLHLACHGIQSAEDPFQSHFLLQDRPLYLADIIKSNTRENAPMGKQLAFLSACHTATGALDMSEEALHLAGGLHCAGYRSVVGTMWSVHDKTARRVAVEVYQRLFKSGSGNPIAEDVAEAVWESLKHLRKDIPWSRLAPFIHMGV